jgi:TorA maturation chaperone TorD
MKSESLTEAQQVALERAESYRFMATMLRYPEGDLLHAALAESQEEGERLHAWSRALLPCVDESLTAEHNRLFSQSVAVSPHQSSYALIDKGVLLGQLAALYGCFGVRTGGSEHETADHIGVELEFLAFLCLKEALYTAEDSEDAMVALRTVCEVRKTLLQEHLGGFAALFAQRLTERSRHSFYLTLASLMTPWLQGELAHEGIATDKQSVHRLPVLTDVQQDESTEEMTCPWAKEEGSPSLSAQ